MMKQSLYEQIVIVVEREEMVRLIGADAEFDLEKIDDRQEQIYFTLGRKTELYEEIEVPKRTPQKPMERLF
jgi:hypothetical protein